MIQTPANKYMATSIQTATPAQLLIMLVDGAIRFCRAGIKGIQDGRFEDANTQLVKAQNIISEFVITLDRTSPLADNLLQLYEYFNHLLIQANIKKTTEPAEEVLQYLIELKETWIQAARLAAASQTEVSHG
ncbi:flagellar export chaperone FliS [Paenibacillus abyssi]|uniref:Flagellar secretion chaperone FliS n=1 Tax=Paenibacillus abyssi TaxID=1340531 RepID=A0A917CK55_9BACL|nr:flagellar export chaperone FliS [Paenibacillus abyssi]GGF91380.1 flagellar protein FliS [Paenibacillus abyssi]